MFCSPVSRRLSSPRALPAELAADVDLEVSRGCRGHPLEEVERVVERVVRPIQVAEVVVIEHRLPRAGWSRPGLLPRFRRRCGGRDRRHDHRPTARRRDILMRLPEGEESRLRVEPAEFPARATGPPAVAARIPAGRPGRGRDALRACDRILGRWRRKALGVRVSRPPGLRSVLRGGRLLGGCGGDEAQAARQDPEPDDAGSPCRASHQRSPRSMGQCARVRRRRAWPPSRRMTPPMDTTCVIVTKGERTSVNDPVYPRRGSSRVEILQGAEVERLPSVRGV